MLPHPEYSVPLPGGHHIALGAMPVIMGILNVTPDSFSDGDSYADTDAVVRRAQEMVRQGVSILDVGGESTRPGADEVSAQAELDRVIPAIDALMAVNTSKPISIDTYKAVVADQAIQAGANIINDVHGLQREPEIADVAALYKTPVIIMHWDKQRDASLDVISEMRRYFAVSLEIAAKAGIAKNGVILDPGFGFAKSVRENYEILRRMSEFQDLGYPLLAGTSRKSMIGKLLDIPAEERLAATIATSSRF